MPNCRKCGLKIAFSSQLLQGQLQAVGSILHFLGQSVPCDWAGKGYKGLAILAQRGTL